MTKARTIFALLAVCTVTSVGAFAPPSAGSITRATRAPAATTCAARPSTSLYLEKEGKGGVSNKLLEETVAPFRGLRLFFYAAFASGAFVGGLITASGVAAALSGVRTDVDLNTEYLNLAIDFGAVALFGVLAKLDLDKGAELSAAVEEKVERKKALKKVGKSMREREQQLQKLNVNVRVTEDGETRMAPVGVMQENAKQHVILVAGPGRAIRDALRGAQLNKQNFAMANILVVPYETGVDVVDKASKPDGGGFGDSRPSYETQPYVAEPVGEGWEEFIAAEIDAAVNQAGENIRDEGIALVVANDGKVLRRGVGKVPWRQMVDELEEAVTGEKKETAVPLLEFLE
ncbi:hypothetical protein ACHAXT_003239 [Thalassiosira profunda]